jgi:prevent-host-death family protein
VRQIKASEFKAKCLKLIDEVNATGEAIIITKRGKAVVRVERQRPVSKTLRGSFKGKIELIGIDGNLPSVWDDLVEGEVEKNLNRLADDILPSRPQSKRR